MSCKGVIKLDKQSLVFTGKVYVGDEWCQQAECARLAKQRGATSGKHFTSSTTVVVWGDLSSQVVSDAKALHSEKLVRARTATDRHVHVVHADGFADLLDGLPAKCVLASVRRGHVPSVPKRPPRIFGGQLQIRVPSGNAHSGQKLEIDLDHLDNGTRVHALTLQKLQRHLARGAIVFVKPATRRPLFDAGWRASSVNWIAEVKSITASSETQQMRLGLGQLLEYRARIAAHTGKPKAALVLSKEPSDPAWSDVCAAVGVLLTWAPDFPGL